MASDIQSHNSVDYDRGSLLPGGENQRLVP
jgi:hypothetical protein